MRTNRRSSLVAASLIGAMILALASASIYAHPVRAVRITGGPIDIVVIIMMENRNYADVIGSPSAPYLNQLARTYGLASNYHDVSNYGSLPEYLGTIAANTFDSWSHCNSPPSFCRGWSPATNPTITDRIESAGLTWKAYMEDMPSNCYAHDIGNYMTIHDPFVYFSHITSNSSECAKDVPAGSGDSRLLSDLSSLSTASNYMWLTPNKCNDMWGCSTSTGDSYLSNLVPKILNSQVFQTQKAAVFITWDEGSTSGHIPGIWAGPSVKHSHASSITYSHYSFLKTIESAWNLPTLTSNDASAAPMTEFLTGTSAGSPLQASFTFTPTNPQVGETVSFKATATGGTSPYTFSWSFGDGASTTVNPASHAYTAPGSYGVTLTVTDSKGSVASNAKPVIVGSVPDFSIAASASSITIRAGSSGTSTITLTSLNQFSGTIGLDASSSFSTLSTSLNPGTIVVAPSTSATSALTVSASLLTPPGTYSVTVKGASGSLTHSVTVSVTVTLLG